MRKLNRPNRSKNMKGMYGRKIPKAPFGALLSGVASIGSSIAGANQADRERKRAEQAREAQALTGQLGVDKAELDNYKDKQYSGIPSYYQANGGTLRTDPTTPVKSIKPIKPVSNVKKKDLLNPFPRKSNKYRALRDIRKIGDSRQATAQELAAFRKVIGNDSRYKQGKNVLANGGTVHTDPTDPKKKTKTVDNGAAQRNKLRRKTYLDQVYKLGLDTTNVEISSLYGSDKGTRPRIGPTRGKLQSLGTTKRQIRGRNKPTYTANYRTTEGKTRGLIPMGDINRIVDRGYKVEPTNKKAYGGSVSKSPSFQTKGGKLMPLSSDMEKAYGNKHYESKIDGTSGIKLNKGGKAVAEIEGGETIKDGTMVYSDRTKVQGKMTYADKASKLAREKATVEVGMSDKDAIGKNTAQRKLAMIDQAEDALFMHQEMRKGKKGAMGMRMAKGGKLTDSDKFIGNRKRNYKMPNNPTSRYIKDGLFKPRAYKEPYAPMAKGGMMRNAVGVDESKLLFKPRTYKEPYYPKKKVGGRIPTPEANVGATSHRSSDRFSPYPLNSGNRALNDYLSYESPGSSQVELNTPATRTSEVDKVLKLTKTLQGKMMNGGMMDDGRGTSVYDSTDTPNFGGKGKMGGGKLRYRKGGRMMAKGGKLQNGGTTGAKNKFGEIVEGVTPFIDNIGNAILTANTPELRSPTLRRAKNLDTSYNANPELAAVNEAVDANVKTVQQGTRNANIARSNIAATRFRGAQAKGKVLANKQNKETALRNQNALNRQGIQAANAATLNRFGERQTARAGDIQDRISANVANLAGDITTGINNRKDEAFDRERLDIARQTYNPGTTRRADLLNPSSIERFKSNPESLKRAYNQYKGTPEESKFLEATGYDPFSDITGPLRGGRRATRRLRRNNRNLT